MNQNFSQSSIARVYVRLQILVRVGEYLNTRRRGQSFYRISLPCLVKIQTVQTSFLVAYDVCAVMGYNMGYNITIHSETYIIRGKNGYCAAAGLYCQEWRI